MFVLCLCCVLFCFVALHRIALHFVVSPGHPDTSIPLNHAMTSLFNSNRVDQFIRFIAYWFRGKDCVWAASKFVYNYTSDSFHTYKGTVNYNQYNYDIIHGSGCLDKGQQIQFLAMDRSASWKYDDSLSAMEMYGSKYDQDISRVLNATNNTYNYVKYPELSSLNSFLYNTDRYTYYIRDGPSCALLPPSFTKGYKRNMFAINSIDRFPYINASTIAINETSTVPAQSCT